MGNSFVSERMTFGAKMKPGKYLAAFGIFLAMAGCNHGNGDFTLEPSDFMKRYDKSRGITPETHGTPLEMAPFSSGDIPEKLPVRDSVFAGSGLKLVVKHSQGYSSVEPLYELKVHEKYSANAAGQPVPVYVRIDPPFNPNYDVRLPYSRFRMLETAEEYQFKGRFLSQSNRETAIGLAQEVLAKTHCAGGRVTQNTDLPELAESYGRNARNASGDSIVSGWVINLRCSRWRQR